MSEVDTTRGEPDDVRRRPALTPASLLVVLLVFYLIVRIELIVVLVLVALLFATVIERPVLKLQSRGIPRAAGILGTYAAILMILVALGLLFVPLISSEFRAFSNEAPAMIEEVAESWRASDNQLLARTGYRLLTQLESRLENPPPPTGATALGLLTGFGGVIFGLVATFVIGFYYLMEKHLLKRLLLDQLQPSTAARVNTIWNDVEAKVGDWLRGQLTLSLVIGTVAGIGYALLDLRFWLLLAVFAGVTELIPIVGPWIGGIPAFIIAMLDSWEKAAAVAVFLVGLQFLENSVLVPRIMKGAIGLSPLTVFLAVLAGAQFMGVLGALLAIPFAAAIQVIVVDALRMRHQRVEEQTAAVVAGMQPQPWRTILTQFLSDSSDRRPRVPADPSEPSARPERTTTIEPEEP